MNTVVSELLDNNDLIMIDTCFAMSDEFENFINSIEIELLSRGKKFIVKNAVMAELYRHMSSDDESTRLKATNAITIICLKRNIFSVHDNNISSEAILKAFADVEFLADFTRSRISNRMALLTNDYKLGKDICDLNKIGSCNGKRVEVYYFNRTGNFKARVYDEELVNVDAVSPNIVQDEIDENKLETEMIEPIVNDRTKIPDVIVDNTESKKSTNWVPVAIASALSLSIGFVLGKFGKSSWKKSI